MKVVLCPIRQKRVNCERDGICERAFPVGSADLCAVREKALDSVLNP
jgi:hypothetical protein